MTNYAQSVAAVLGLRTNDVAAVLELLAEGATIPFIARYRKDRTGALDEVQIQQVQDEATRQQEYADRKAFIEKTITEQGKMTEELQARINKARRKKPNDSAPAAGIKRNAPIAYRQSLSKTPFL